MSDLLKEFGDFLKSPDSKAIWNEVKENRRRLQACPCHRFDGPHVFGSKVTCTHCGGRVSATDAAAYCEGFRAAGGDPAQVWPAEYGAGSGGSVTTGGLQG